VIAIGSRTHVCAQEPVLVSVGGDNALKLWQCDESGARLLRERAGDVLRAHAPLSHAPTQATPPHLS
jgi:hypothetical protein